MAYVLLHGWGGSKKSMEPLADLLISNGEAVMNIDLPGFGDEPNPPSDWGVEEYADFVSKKIEGENLDSKKVILIGHSFGGALCLLIASKRPEWLEKLVVIAPSWRRQTQASTNTKNSLKKVGKSIFQIFPPVLKKIIYKLLFPKSDLFLRFDLESNYRKIVTQDLSKQVGAINIPTLILWGESDNYVTIADGKELQEKIRFSVLETLEKGRHGLPFQETKWVYSKLRQNGFVKENMKV